MIYFADNLQRYRIKINDMVSIEKRIGHFAELGDVLSELLGNKTCNHPLSKQLKEDFEYLMETQIHFNGWFTPKMVQLAIENIIEMLDEKALNQWLEDYKEKFSTTPKTVGVILAGNIPAVGFHDFLSVLITGNKFIGKLSSKDQHLLPFFAKILIQLNSDFESLIEFTSDPIKTLDAIIATGSDNSSRYFEHYFKKYPNIIRKNRTSVAILTGNESKEELRELGKDIFMFYGLGCRNVSKLFVPKGYKFETFFEAIVDFGFVAENNKYFNNYEYNKTIHLLNSEKLFDNNFIVLKEDENLTSPIGLLNYSFYESYEEVVKNVEHQRESIQCIVGENYISFGKTQVPSLTDYADNVNSLEFLTSIG